MRHSMHFRCSPGRVDWTGGIAFSYLFWTFSFFTIHVRSSAQLLVRQRGRYLTKTQEGVLE